MSHSALPKEQQSAYERWELSSFDGPQAGAYRPGQARRPGQASGVASQQQQQQQQAQQAAQLAAELEEARKQGHAAGLSEGYIEGLAQGRAQAEQERALLLAIADGFGSEVARANELIAADVLQLALDVAKAMLKSTLQVNPERVLPVVREAVRYLPTVQQPALLILNPADAALIDSQIGDELRNAGWRVTDDSRLERGGCRVETASNQIDATAATRWQRISAALGAESDWLVE